MDSMGMDSMDGKRLWFDRLTTNGFRLTTNGFRNAAE